MDRESGEVRRKWDDLGLLYWGLDPVSTVPHENILYCRYVQTSIVISTHICFVLCFVPKYCNLGVQILIGSKTYKSQLLCNTILNYRHFKVLLLCNVILNYRLLKVLSCNGTIKHIIVQYNRIIVSLYNSKTVVWVLLLTYRNIWLYLLKICFCVVLNDSNTVLASQIIFPTLSVVLTDASRKVGVLPPRE